MKQRKPKPRTAPRRRASPSVESHVLAAARETPAWEIDMFVLPVIIEAEGDAPISTTMLVAGPYVLSATGSVGHLAEPGPVAATLADVLREAAGRAKVWPRVVRVRHRRLVDPLQAALGDAPARVEWHVPLADLGAVRNGLLEELCGSGPTLLPAYVAPTYAGWRLPEGLTAALFAAAATYWDRAPWRSVANTQLLYAEMTDGRALTCVVLGYGGIEHGLVLYDDPRDIQTMHHIDEPWAYDALRGGNITLTFEAPGELPPQMVREVRAAGWHLAAPDAIPRVLPCNTLAGGLSAEAVGDLTTLLLLVPRFVEAHRDLITGEAAVSEWPRWTDAETGVTLSYEGFVDLSDPGPWREAKALSTAMAEGPMAAPERALERGRTVFASEEEAIQAVEPVVVGLSAAFRHWRLTKGARIGTATRDSDRATHFLVLLYLVHRVPIEAVSELDLRVFLFERGIEYEASQRGRASEGLIDSLLSFFAYLSEERGLSCPWARAVLEERSAYMRRWRAYRSSTRDPEARAAWYDELSADLWARVLLPETLLGTEDNAVEPGRDEHYVGWELQRRWLIWRDEAVRTGTREPELLRAALLPLQRAWERSPHPALDGRSPMQAVREERARARAAPH